MKARYLPALALLSTSALAQPAVPFFAQTLPLSLPSDPAVGNGLLLATSQLTGPQFFSLDGDPVTDPLGGQAVAADLVGTLAAVSTPGAGVLLFDVGASPPVFLGSFPFAGAKQLAMGADDDGYVVYAENGGTSISRFKLTGDGAGNFTAEALEPWATGGPVISLDYDDEGQQLVAVVSGVGVLLFTPDGQLNTLSGEALGPAAFAYREGERYLLMSSSTAGKIYVRRLWVESDEGLPFTVPGVSPFHLATSGDTLAVQDITESNYKLVSVSAVIAALDFPSSGGTGGSGGSGNSGGSSHEPSLPGGGKAGPSAAPRNTGCATFPITALPVLLVLWCSRRLRS